MEFITTYFKELASVIVPLLTWFLNSRLLPRARLVQGIRHASTLILDEPTLSENGEIVAPRKVVNIAQISFANTGTQPARDVQITFNWKPQHLNISPQRDFNVKSAPDDRFTVLLGTLPPRDFVVIDLLTVNGALPAITSARCDECAASEIPLSPQEVYPKWKIALVLTLMLIGIGTSVYAAITLLQFISVTAS